MPFRESKRLPRRELLATLGAGFGAALSACASSSPTAASTVTNTGTTGGTGSSCAITPSETEGPYPDKTGMLNNPAFFRRDVTEGRPGLPVTLTLTIVNVNSGCSPVSNASVEIWQCDASGNYSEYSQPGYDGTGKTFLRGLQTSDANGQVTFTTIYPGWYAGRATHIHIEVTMNGRSVKVTQIAFPETINNAVYATGVYASRGSNPTSNLQDGIFADSLSSELVTPSGNPAAGYSASYQVGVSV